MLVSNKVVFVGKAMSSSSHPAIQKDSYQTPIDIHEGQIPNRASGVVLHAITYLNLVNKDAYLKSHDGLDLIICIILGGMLGWFCSKITFLKAAFIVSTISVTCYFLAFFLFLHYSIWYPWLIISIIISPAAFCMSLIPVHDTFISHRRTDGWLLAQTIEKGFRDLGVPAFIDVMHSEPGSLTKNLQHHIDLANNFIMLITTDAITDLAESGDNSWVAMEYNYAKEKKKNIVPVFMKGVPIESLSKESSLLTEIFETSGPEYVPVHPEESFSRILMYLKCGLSKKNR